MNNPIMYADPSGHFLISTAIALGFWIGLGIGAIGGVTLGGIFAYNLAKENGAEGFSLFGFTMLGKFAAFWSHRIYRMIFGGF